MFTFCDIFSGSGQGLVTNTAILILVDHFKEKQGMALGASFMVMAIGGIVAPQIARLLLSYCSTQASILIYGGQILGGIIGSLMFTPVIDSGDKKEAEQSLKGSENLKNWQNNPIAKMIILIKWSLLKDPHFLLTILGSSYSVNALFNFLLYLPLYSGSVGMTLSQKSVLLSVIAGIDLGILLCPAQSVRLLRNY